MCNGFSLLHRGECIISIDLLNWIIYVIKVYFYNTVSLMFALKRKISAQILCQKSIKKYILASRKKYWETNKLEKLKYYRIYIDPYILL